MGIIPIVGGDFYGSELAISRYQSLIKDKRIILSESYISVPELFVRQSIDFYFRAYSDYSVPFTVYEACTLQKPLIVLNSGFLPVLVEKTRIGIVLDSETLWQKNTLNELRAIDTYLYGDFLNDRSWSSIKTICDEL